MLTLYRSLVTKNGSGALVRRDQTRRSDPSLFHVSPKLELASKGGGTGQKARRLQVSDTRFPRQGPRSAGTRALLADNATELRIQADGPHSEDAGPGYEDGRLWVVVGITPVGTATAGDIWFALGNSTAACGLGSHYSGPIFLTNIAPGNSVMAVVCQGGVELAAAQLPLPRTVAGPSLSFSVAVHSMATVSNSASLVESASSALCWSLGIDEFCEGRVTVTVAKPGLRVSELAVRALALSNVEAARWRKGLVTNTSFLSAPGFDVVFNSSSAFLDARVDVPVPGRQLRTIGQPCLSHYDCIGEVTGEVTINGTTTDEYAWGRAFCALWGSPLTGGAGPTCDHCQLYCTSAEFSSVDGVCPEGCGDIPPNGWRPSCLSAEKLRSTYKCSNRYQFEVRSHTRNETVPSPRRSDVPIVRSLSGFNNIIGAVVITQKRVGKAECSANENQGFVAFARANGVNCTGSGKLDSSPYGIDPTFSRFSSLFNGKHTATEFYAGQLISDSEEVKNEHFSQPTEGFYGADGFIPYGFFPHQWDPANKRHKNDSWILNSAKDEFKLFFDVRIGSAQADLLLTYIQDGRFIDDSTDMIEIDIVTYNAEVNMLASIHFTFHVEKTGGITWDYSMRSIDAKVETSIVHTFLESLVILFLIISFLVEFKDIIDLVYALRFGEYIMSPFNWLDISGFVIQSLAWTKWYAFKSGIAAVRLDNPSNFFVLADPFSKIRPFTANEKEEYALLKLIEDVTRLADLEVEYSSLVGIIVVLLTFKVIKSLHFQPRMGLITRTLAQAGSNLVHFMILFGLIFFGYGFVGHVMFGTQLAAMSTLSNSMRTLGYILLNFDSTQFHSQMRHAVRRDADGGASLEFEVYIWSYVFVNMFILLNILLAILVAGYTEVASSANGGESVWADLYDFFGYYLCKVFLPAERFISDERLLTHVQKELLATSNKGGLGNFQHIQSLKATCALDSRRAILLGGGISMEQRHLRLLVSQLLHDRSTATAACDTIDASDRSVNQSQINIDESISLNGSAPDVAITRNISHDFPKVRNRIRKRSSLSESMQQALMRSEAVLALRTNQLVEDLLRRHGDEIRSKSAEISRDVRNLMEIDSQTRLLRIEETLGRGLESLGSRIDVLEQQLDSALTGKDLNRFPSSLLEEKMKKLDRKLQSSNNCMYSTVSTPKKSAEDRLGTNEDALTLHVRIMSARALPRMDILSACNPYCHLFLTTANGPAEQHQATRVLSGLNPTWRETFDFNVPSRTMRLVIALWDRDTITQDDLVGSADLELRDLEPGVVVDDWFPLHNPSLASRLSNSAIRIQALLRSNASSPENGDKPESQEFDTDGTGTAHVHHHFVSAEVRDR